MEKLGKLTSSFLSPEATLHWLDDDLLHIQDRLTTGIGSKKIAVYGNGWAYLFGPVLREHVRVKRGNEVLSLRGYGAAFVPPFSVIEWHVGTLRGALYQTVVSTKPVPADLPDAPCCFETDDDSIPQSVDEVFARVREAVHPVPIGVAEEGHGLAKALRQYLTGHYTEPLRLAEVAQRMGFSHQLLGRHFKRCYGMTPLTYLNRLRVINSILPLLNGESVTDAAYEMGFNDPRLFYDHYRRYVATHPSRLKDSLR